MKTFLGIGTGPAIGLETAARFAREGYRAVLSARNPGRTQALAQRMRADGSVAEARQVNAGDLADVAELVAAVERDFGGIDVLHYNAAAWRQATLADQPLDGVLPDLAVNIGGALAAAQAVAPAMIRRGSGSILFTGGGIGLKPQSDLLSLSIGKAGLRALALGLHEALAGNGVHVATVTVAGVVSPGSADTAAIGQLFWHLHAQPPGTWEVERLYTPRG